ncbi:MAG: hypothetical protein ABSC55_27520 [Syntrophorhabdales bacterium]
MLVDDRSISVRDFLLDEQDRIYRFPLSRFSAMVRDPKTHPYPQFAGKRMRGAEVFVDLDGSRPVGITRMAYFTLLFNENGILNKELHMRQQMARYNLHINAPIPAEDAGVLDAEHRFLSSGGQWKPTPDLEARLRDAALGKVKCHRV